MIIENEFDTYGSIIDLNVMFVSEVDMIIDKTERFQRFLVHNKQIKDKETHYTL